MFNNRKNLEKWTIILRDKATSITKFQYAGTIKKGKSWNVKICGQREDSGMWYNGDRDTPATEDTELQRGGRSL